MSEQPAQSARLAEGTRRRKLIAAMSEQVEAALEEFTRMVIDGEIDVEAAVTNGQDVYLEAVITPKGLREIGYGQ
jgi:hypothetical protein